MIKPVQKRDLSLKALIKLIQGLVILSLFWQTQSHATLYHDLHDHQHCSICLIIGHFQCLESYDYSLVFTNVTIHQKPHIALHLELIFLFDIQASARAPPVFT